jgi:hypothetical protein
VENLKPTFENAHVPTTNEICRTLGWPELEIKSVTHVNGNLLFLIDKRNFFLQFDLQKRSFVEWQRYLSAEINDSVNLLTIGGFGNIQGLFAAFGYYKINEVLLEFR